MPLFTLRLIFSVVPHDGGAVLGKAVGPVVCHLLLLSLCSTELATVLPRVVLAAADDRWAQSAQHTTNKHKGKQNIPKPLVE